MRNYDYTSIVDGKKVTTNELLEHRRKKLAHNLKNIIEENYYNEIKDKRAEQLSVADYQKLSHYIINDV